MLLDACLRRTAVERPRVPAVVTDGGTLTYGMLDQDANAVADRLRADGLGPGSRIGLVMPPSLAFASALFGILRAGATVVPVDPRLGPEDRAARLAGCDRIVEDALPMSKGVIVVSLDDPGPDPTAIVVHTSGTTSAPKPIGLTDANFWWSAAGSAVALGHDPHERWLCAMPLAHVGGLSILIRAAIGGTTAILHPGFDAERVARDLASPEGPTLISVVPTMLSRLLDAGVTNPPALRAALVGGGPIPPALVERARAAGIRCVTTYGMTEACSQITTGGPPLFCTRVRIAPDGEILVRSPTVAPGALADDGWLHTGDLGQRDDAGHLAITGRLADTIVTGGENVAPAEVEAVLEAHPAVAEAAVHARPDDEWGEAVIATVVLRPGMHADPENLRAHVRERLAGFKVPKDIAFAATLPRTASGKLMRREL
ncbi:MAG: AMP-binding protein [Solirubrobacteraceae bacterium]|nr:AMP-binding protein [Solirubrobacteraceae bacterium]